MVLHLGDHDLVARADPEPLGAAGTWSRSTARTRRRFSDSETFLVKTTSSRLGALMNAGHLVARELERRGRLGAERVHRARDVGVVPRVELGQRVEHDLRLLRGVRAVEVDERHTVHLAGQDREVLADRLYVERVTGSLAHAFAVSLTPKRA